MSQPPAGSQLRALWVQAGWEHPQGADSGKGFPGCQAPGPTGLAGTSEQERDKQQSAPPPPPPVASAGVSCGAVHSRTVLSLLLLYLSSLHRLFLVSYLCLRVCTLFCLGAPFLFWV